MAFPALVARHFGWRLIVDAIGGSDVDWRSGEGTTAGSSGLERVQSGVIDASPNVVVIMFGLNVFGGRVPLTQYQLDYRSMLQQVATAGISPVLCVGQPAVNSTVTDAALVGINQAIASAADAVPGCTFVDLTGAWGPANWYGGSGPVFVAADNAHPNDAGHAYLAARIIDAVRPSSARAPRVLTKADPTSRLGLTRGNAVPAAAAAFGGAVLVGIPAVWRRRRQRSPI